LNRKGKEWNIYSHHYSWKFLFRLIGFESKLPYDVKYTSATYMFDNPDQFSNPDFKNRIDLVRSITGHDRQSDVTERYISSLWGSPYGIPVRDYYNKHRVFPFSIEEFPPGRNVDDRMRDREGGSDETALNA
jgi:hypothetical protein